MTLREELGGIARTLVGALSPKYMSKPIYIQEQEDTAIANALTAIEALLLKTVDCEACSPKKECWKYGTIEEEYISRQEAYEKALGEFNKLACPDTSDTSIITMDDVLFEEALRNAFGIKEGR